MKRRTFGGTVLTLWLIAAFCTAVPASGQVLTGVVRDAATAQPLPGVFVSLEDTAGARVGLALSDGNGRYAVRAMPGVPYALVAELIGYRSHREAGLVLRRGATTRDLVLAVRAVDVEGITVRGSARCPSVPPEEALELIRLRDEARKALTLVASEAGLGGLRFESVRYSAVLDTLLRRTRRVRRQSIPGWGAAPFAVPEGLVDRGFIHMDEDGVTHFYGPDARTLLSDAFLDAYCFRLDRPGAGDAEHLGRIGLRFAPARVRDAVDITGVLWLDEASTEVRALEFSYVRLPWPVTGRGSGGSLEFRRLPGGQWIIDRWRIVVPEVERRTVDASAWGVRGPVDGSWKLIGFTEEGAHIRRLTLADGTVLPASRAAAVVGVVMDSTARAPLPHARVAVEGTDLWVRTDARGAFRLDDLEEGPWSVTFSHSRLDTLGIRPDPAVVWLRAGELTEITLAIPSAATVLSGACPGQSEGATVVGGTVRARGDGVPLAGARVGVSWAPSGAPSAAASPAAEASFEVIADADGRYVACGVPADREVQLRPSFLGRSGRAVVVRSEGAAGRIQPLEVALERPSAVGGRVVDRETGRPVVAAEVRLDSVLRISDAEGRFHFPDVAPGAMTLEIRHLAYGVRKHELEAGEGRAIQLEIELLPQAIELEGITVTTASRPLEQATVAGSFFRRRQELGALGLGHFIGPEAVEARMPTSVTDLLRGVPGVRLHYAQGRAGRPLVRIEGGRSTLCEDRLPVLIVDGLEMRLDPGTGSIDDVVSATDVLAVEVYRTAAEVPGEYGGAGAACGVIAVWTKRFDD